jgi:hypothetical protein
MFAFIPGLGGQEILLLCLLCFAPVVVAVVALLVTQAGRKSGGRSSVADLEEENRRLRDELRRAKRDNPAPPE